MHVPAPTVDLSQCTYCGLCARTCRFGAILCGNDNILIMPELCHACGGCARVCPTRAMTTAPRQVGTVEQASAVDGILCVTGRIQIGEPRSVPVIKSVRGAINGSAGDTIVDAPPGSSCPAVAAVEDADFVCLVAESTPFGLNDLKMVKETIDVLGLPCGVVINREGLGDDRVRRYCEENDLPVIGTVPNDRRIAVDTAAGRLALDTVPRFADAIAAIADRHEGVRKACVS